MKTYKQGYDWATILTTLIEDNIISKQVATDISELSVRYAFNQGMVDSCNDWLHKMRIYEKELTKNVKNGYVRNMRILRRNKENEPKK